MAENGEATEAGPGHNSEQRRNTIKSACAEISELEEQRKEIGQQIRTIKQKRVKGDLGMKISDFNAAYRLYLLEGDDRSQFFATLRETFRALGVGDQLNFLDVPEPDDAHQVHQPEGATA